MRRLSIVRFIVAILLFASAHAAEAIPQQLVGVWATAQSVMNGPFLFEGQALYLGEDGVGSIVGGPPPIGFKIIATFNPETNMIDFDAYEGNRRGFHGTMQYDAVRATITLGVPQHRPMYRRFDDFTDEMKRGLGR